MSGRNELTEVSGTGIGFIPNLTGVFGRAFAAVPATPVRLGRVFTEQIPPVYLVRTLPNIPLDDCTDHRRCSDGAHPTTVLNVRSSIKVI